MLGSMQLMCGRSRYLYTHIATEAITAFIITMYCYRKPRDIYQQNSTTNNC